MTEERHDDDRLRNTMERVADFGRDTVRPGLRLAGVTLRRAARTSGPLLRVGVRKLLGERQATPDSQDGELLRAARDRETAALSALLEVDRAAQAQVEAISHLQEELEDRGDAQELLRPSMDLLLRQEQELGAERNRLLIARREEREEVCRLEKEFGTRSTRSEDLKRIGGRLEQAGEALTDWMDRISNRVKRCVTTRSCKTR